MSVLLQTLIVLPATALLNWAQNGLNERRRLSIEPDRAMQKWKVFFRSSRAGFLLPTSVIRISVNKLGFLLVNMFDLQVVHSRD